MDPWLNVVPRGTYDQGAGYERSTFTIGRSEMSTDEEAWPAITAINNDAGACAITYNQVYTGFFEAKYKPEKFGLMGPVICQDDLVMYWKAGTFWQRFFQAMEKRNRKSVIGRIGNVYRQYVPKAAANANFAFTAGVTATQPAPTSVDVTSLQGGNLPMSELLQDYLDATAQELNEEGASEGNSNGWITMGDAGVIYTLYIGQAASNKILLNNSELRQDYNSSFMSLKEANPVIQRMGATRVIKNFRHLINLFPARWTTLQVDTTGAQGHGIGYVYGADDGVLKRVPTWQMVGSDFSLTDSTIVTKGDLAQVNPSWRNPALAMYESCEVLSPLVMTEEVLMPMNSAPGMKLKPQNYFGEWAFVTGNDAFLGISGCTGIQDPMHKQGRHFGEYRHAFKPEFPTFGRMILFKRCSNSFDELRCT